MEQYCDKCGWIHVGEDGLYTFVTADTTKLKVKVVPLQTKQAHRRGVVTAVPILDPGTGGWCVVNGSLRPPFLREGEPMHFVR